MERTWIWLLSMRHIPNLNTDSGYTWTEPPLISGTIIPSLRTKVTSGKKRAFSWQSRSYTFPLLFLFGHWLMSGSVWPHALVAPPGSSGHGISQARIMEWVAIPFSRGSSWPRDWNPISCSVGGFLTTTSSYFCNHQCMRKQLIQKEVWGCSLSLHHFILPYV